jgi:hypothetical protein
MDCKVIKRRSKTEKRWSEEKRLLTSGMVEMVSIEKS